MRTLQSVFLVLLGCTLCAGEQDLTGALNSIAAYRATQQVEGTIRTWGDTRMQRVVAQWEHGFSRVQPESASKRICVEQHLPWEVCNTGEADVALIERRPLAC